MSDCTHPLIGIIGGNPSGILTRTEWCLKCGHVFEEQEQVNDHRTSLPYLP